MRRTSLNGVICSIVRHIYLSTLCLLDYLQSTYYSLQDIWKIRLQLTKPVTWVPLMWGVICGAAASGERVLVGWIEVDAAGEWKGGRR